jgi:hypothetical protein
MPLRLVTYAGLSAIVKPLKIWHVLFDFKAIGLKTAYDTLHFRMLKQNSVNAITLGYVRGIVDDS